MIRGKMGYFFQMTVSYLFISDNFCQLRKVFPKQEKRHENDRET